MTSRRKLAVIVLTVGLVGASCGDDDASSTTAGATTTAAGESSTTKVPETAAVTTTAAGGDTTTTKAPPETTTTAAGTTTSVVVATTTTTPVVTTSGIVTLPTVVTLPTITTVVTGLNYAAEANYGNQAASAGFTPDPVEYAVIGGGSVDVSYLGGGCVGFASVAPDIDFQWSGSTGTRLRFLFFPDDATSDPVLIINAPDGSWYCNDDYPPSRFPVLDFPTGPNGHYDIWVGAYAGGLLPGTLYVTELAYNPVDAKPPGA